jgi:uncharacterized membrane protein YcaP (DUF421 family)
MDVNSMMQYLTESPVMLLIGIAAAVIVFKLTRRMVHSILSMIVWAAVWYFLKKYGF